MGRVEGASNGEGLSTDSNGCSTCSNMAVICGPEVRREGAGGTPEPGRDDTGWPELPVGRGKVGSCLV